ncbi:hypothetical protein GCM10027290_58920 [Micromonospora sonneratiae]
MRLVSTLRAMMLDTLMFGLVSWIFGLAVLYLVIRLAVRHAIKDADGRRAAERPRNSA